MHSSASPAGSLWEEGEAGYGDSFPLCTLRSPSIQSFLAFSFCDLNGQTFLLKRTLSDNHAPVINWRLKAWEIWIIDFDPDLSFLISSQSWTSLFAGDIPPGGPDLCGVDLCGKAQGAEGLVGGLGGGGDVDEHQRFGVTPEAGLEQVGELAVPEGDVALLVAQGHDDITCNSVRSHCRLDRSEKR